MATESSPTYSSSYSMSAGDEDIFLSLSQSNRNSYNVGKEVSNTSPVQSPPLSPSPVRSPLPLSPPTAKPTVLIFDPLMNNNGLRSNDSRLIITKNSIVSPYISPTKLQNTQAKPVMNRPATIKYQSKTQHSSDDREYHLATLGSEVKQSAVHSKHKRWSSFDTSTIKSSNLLGMMGRNSRDKGSKSQPHTPIVGNRKSLPKKTTPSPLPVINNSLHIADLTTTFSTMSSESTPMKQTDLLDSIFNLAPSPCKRMPDTSFLNNESTTSYAGAYETKLRTSEIEPSPHQIELPAFSDVMVYARLCNLMEAYRSVDKNFNFSQMVGLSRLEMEGFVRTHIPPMSSSLKKTHSPIVQKVLQCADDLVVEDAIGSGKNVDDRIEVAIFRSDALRQIIAVWRGTTEGQIKPVRNREMRSIQGTNLKDGMLPSFQQASLKENIEKRLFERLEKLMEENPFFDLTTTGFSQGAALATICASRYASLYPMMRVHCNVFGCPKIGGEKWRNDTHSLPNLKVIRIQTEDDSSANAPADPSFLHVGHTILLCSGSSSIVKNASPSLKGKKVDLRALAFKFDKPAHTKSTFFKIKKNASNHTIDAYSSMLNQFSLQKLAWTKEYVGENVGEGVHGMKNEKRNMV